MISFEIIALRIRPFTHLCIKPDKYLKLISKLPSEISEACMAHLRTRDRSPHTYTYEYYSYAWK